MHREVIRRGNAVCDSIDAHGRHFNCVRTCQQISAQWMQNATSVRHHGEAPADDRTKHLRGHFPQKTTTFFAVLSSLIGHEFTVLQR